MLKIKDITGKIIEVTNLRLAIRQCKLCIKSPFRMESGHTVGENNAFMLEQLLRMKKEQLKIQTD